MADYIANQINWLPLQLVQQADHETPITGIAYDDADLLVRYQKQGSTAIVTKVLTTDDWIEGVDGGYQVRFDADECDTPGTLMYWVDYAGTPIAWTYPGAIVLSDPADGGDTALTYTVTDADTGAVLIGALVELYTDSGRTVQGPRGTTNAAGQITFRLAAVTYYPTITYGGISQAGASFSGSAGSVAQTFTLPAASDTGATFDPELGSELDHIRLALGDIHDNSTAGAVSSPLLQDTVIQAKLDAVGYVEALAQLAEFLAARYANLPDTYQQGGSNGLKYTWGERVKQWLDLAARARGGKVKIPGQQRIYRPGAAVQKTTAQATLTSPAAGSQFRSD